MVDISAVGSSIQFSGGLNLVVTQFSDEGTPFDSPDVDLSENGKNLNGEMISSRKPSVLTLNISVIPGSDDDRKLKSFARKNLLAKGNVETISSLKIDQAVLTIPAQNESAEGSPSRRMICTFINGRMKTGSMGFSSSSEGRLSSGNYSFEFENIKMSGNL